MPIPFSTLKLKIITKAWKLAKVERWMHRIPLLSQWRKSKLDTSPEKNDATIIPIHQIIRNGENTVLPYPILQPLIEQAAGHFILDRCPCRSAENCKTFPHDFGCLYLGPAVNDIPLGVGKHIAIEKALTHLEKGIQHGLIPMIVHASFDAEMLSIDYTHMLAICFCCDCCCTVRHHLRLGPSTFDETIHRLPGLTVQVTGKCIACGACAEVCPVDAIDINGSAVINQALCKGCGLCVSSCPQEAIEISLDDTQSAIEELFARIRTRTAIGV